MTEQISVTRALTELKTLDARIRQNIATQYMTYEIDGRLAVNKTKDAFTSNATSSFQSFKSLVERRNRVKRAIVLSNAATDVKVGSTTYKVADAIERKNSIAYEKMMLDALRQQLRTTSAEIERQNLKASAALDSMLEKAVAADTTNASGIIEQITESYRQKNFAHSVDPIKIEEEIKKLEDSILEFEQNVDFALSEINATTKITV